MLYISSLHFAISVLCWVTSVAGALYAASLIYKSFRSEKIARRLYDAEASIMFLEKQSQSVGKLQKDLAILQDQLIEQKDVIDKLSGYLSNHATIIEKMQQH